MYDLSTILQFLVIGIGVGCIYGLIGIGFSVIFNASGVINFAQGGFAMLGGMLTYLLFKVAGLPFVLAAAAAVLATSAVGVAVEFLTVRPLLRRNARPFMLILATLAVQILLENSALHLIDDQPHSLPSFSAATPIKLGGVAISPQTLWIVGVSLLIVYLLGLLYRRTYLGKAMRACAVNSEVARMLGIRVERMMAYAFAISAGLGAVAGILITPVQYTAFYVGVPYAINGFIAAIIGGFGNAAGAFAGGLLLGIIQSIAVVFVDAGYKNTVAFALLLILLVVRPTGLFGSLVEE